MKWCGNMEFISSTPLALKFVLTRLRGNTSRVLGDIKATYSIRVLVFLASPILMSDLNDEADSIKEFGQPSSLRGKANHNSSSRA